MSSLLETKENLKKFYNRNEAFAAPALKFCLSFLIFLLINIKLGYNDKIDSVIVVLVAALFCSFMPLKVTAVVAGGFLLLHFYALAPECALVMGVLLFLMFLLYLRFVPKETIVVLITPILFFLKIPYTIPIAMGLIGGPASVISVSFGIIITYLVEYTEMNATTISAMDTETSITKLRYVVDGILTNKAMLVMLLSFAITLLVVYIVRRKSMDHAWMIAIISGALLNVFVLLVGEFLFELNYSILGILFGSVISAFLCRLLQFFTFNIDYSRAENVQFEDDEYYYYVKAVPKIAVAAPDKRVKKINIKREEMSPEVRGTVKTVKTSHGVSHTSTMRDER